MCHLTKSIIDYHKYINKFQTFSLMVLFFLHIHSTYNLNFNFYQVSKKSILFSLNHLYIEFCNPESVLPDTHYRNDP